MRRPSLVLALVPASLLALLAPPSFGATLLVSNLNDVAAGSLRQAVQDHAPGDTIRFAPGLTGTITNTGLVWDLTRPVTIVGPGAGVIELSGGNTRSLFQVSNGEVRISGLTLRNGWGLWGSAINSTDTLRVTRCVFRSNRGTMGGSAIRALGVLEVTECSFESNVADFGNGAISTAAATTITGSTFRANSGGALEAGASLLFENCTVAGNSNPGGGALRLVGSPQAVIDCTISGNSSSINAGGVYTNGTLPQFLNTIIAGNTGANRDVTGACVSLGYNLIGDATGSIGFGMVGSHDQVGSNGNPIDPMLAPIGDYGGPTWTMPPRPFSPAIDQGNSGTIFDQRGRARFYDQPYVLNPAGGDASDIGAYELRPAIRTVTTLADAGAGSLRQAVADLHPFDADSVKFAANVRGTLTLTSGEIVCAKPGVIAGPGAWDLAVHGNNASRLFNVSTGVTFEIAGLTLTGARETHGVAVVGYGNTTVRECRVVGNHWTPSEFTFGGILREIPPALLRVENCTIANNTTGFGGGIFTGFGPDQGGATDVVNCTISGNTGAGIVSTGSATTVLHSTISNNNVDGVDGGGIWHLQGPALVLGSTIVAGNLGPADVAGVYTSWGFNLVGKVGTASGLVHGVNHDRVGTSISPLVAGIGVLQANGGPGETHALLPGSLAIDKGRTFRLLDQRGAARYDDPGVANEESACDIGAYERNPTSVVAVEPEGPEAGLALFAPRPNPAPGGVTSFASRLARASDITLDVHDVTGRRVRNLVSGRREAGDHHDAWDGRDDAGRTVRAGVYFVRLVTEGRAVAESIVVLR